MNAIYYLEPTELHPLFVGYPYYLVEKLFIGFSTTILGQSLFEDGKGSVVWRLLISG
jgi:hypothetical protein